MTGLSRQFSGFKARCSVHLPDDTFLTCEGLFVALWFDYLRLFMSYASEGTEFFFPDSAFRWVRVPYQIGMLTSKGCRTKDISQAGEANILII